MDNGRVRILFTPPGFLTPIRVAWVEQTKRILPQLIELAEHLRKDDVDCLMGIPFNQPLMVTREREGSLFERLLSDKEWQQWWENLWWVFTHDLRSFTEELRRSRTKLEVDFVIVPVVRESIPNLKKWLRYYDLPPLSSRIIFAGFDDEILRLRVERGFELIHIPSEYQKLLRILKNREDKAESRQDGTHLSAGSGRQNAASKDAGSAIGKPSCEKTSREDTQHLRCNEASDSAARLEAMLLERRRKEEEEARREAILLEEASKRVSAASPDETLYLDSRSISLSRERRLDSAKEVIPFETLSSPDKSGPLTILWEKKPRSKKVPPRVKTEVFLGAATPRVVVPGSEFVARFAAYDEKFRQRVSTIFKKEAPRAEALLDLDSCRWKVGTKVSVRLSAKDLIVKTGAQAFTWDGEYEMLRFDVEVPPDCRATQAVLKFDIMIEGVIITTLRPEIEITKNLEAVREEQVKKIEVRSPRTAFASYATKDRRSVLGRVRSLQIHTGIDVFLDCMSIRPGEEWKTEVVKQIHDREVFWLFWSRRAKESGWVEWEWRQALAAKTLLGIQPHPLEPSDLAPPPPELADLQFGSAYECYIFNLQESWFKYKLHHLKETVSRFFHR